MATLIPTIVQNAITGKVLMLGYSNPESLKLTQETGFVHFYSRSRQKLWKKGETSGNTLVLASIQVDCDQDTYLIKVLPNGPTCHLGTESCFDTNIIEKDYHFDFLNRFLGYLTDRHMENDPSSYTSKLISDPIGFVIKKIIEETGEVIESVLADDGRAAEEIADLLYHLSCLMIRKDINVSSVYHVLNQRKGVPHHEPPQSL